MSVQSTRVNLNANHFPFLSEFAGRGIFVKNLDQTYIGSLVNRDDQEKDTGVPILYYGHNIIATGNGYQSIDYISVTQGVAGVSDFVDVFPVYEAVGGGKAFIGYTASGRFFYCSDPYYTWVDLGTIAGAAGKDVTWAYINGITYVYIANVGCKKFNFSTDAFVDVTLTGLTAANILGIVAVLGYLVAWTVDYVAWSSLLDPTDFTPSLVTGAGGGAVQGAKGNIVCCKSHTVGFMVYTNQNAVAAPSSGNTRYPFNFRELVASGGIAGSDLVTWDALSGNHYAYTTSGMQTVSLQNTATIFPELTDFLAGAVIEDLDETTNTFTVTRLSEVMKKRLQLVSDRYLVISYGVTSLTHALIYDIAHRRWGKLKIPHVAVFEFSLLQAETVETPRRSIAFLGADGSVKVVRIDARNPTANGVALLGKYQWTRTRSTTLETIEVDNKVPNGALECVDLYEIPKTRAKASKSGFLLQDSDLNCSYAFSTTGVCHSLLFKGAFNLNTVVINTHVNGRF